MGVNPKIGGNPKMVWMSQGVTLGGIENHGGLYRWMFPKIGVFPPKMDGLFHGKPYFLMDDLGVPLFLETPKYLEDHPRTCGRG